MATLFPCSGCGKNLKCREEWAGRKIKAPCCGQVLTVPQAEPSAPLPEADWQKVLPALILVWVLGATFVLKLENLDHTGLTRWDEAHHAVVAQNVLKHPLKPTIIDAP